MLYVLESLAFVLQVAVVVILTRAYLRTRDVGFVWLGVAVVIWPYISGLLQWGERSLTDRLLHQQPVGVYPFTLVERGRLTIGELLGSFSMLHILVGAGLMLVAVVYLGRKRSTNIADSPEAS